MHLSGYGWFCEEVGSAPKVYEWSPAVAALESDLAQASEMVRTPLRSKASLFNPLIHSSGSPTAFAFNSEASEFVPCSSQEISTASQAPESSAVPVPAFLALQASTAPETHTTVMLRNVPCALTRKNLLSILNDAGFAGLYDFVYPSALPCESATVLRGRLGEVSAGGGGPLGGIHGKPHPQCGLWRSFLCGQ